MKKIRFWWVKLNSFIEVHYRSIILPFFIERNAKIIERERIIGRYFDCSLVVSNGHIILAYFVKSETSVKCYFEMLRVDLECECVELNGLIVVSFFPCLISESVIFLGLSFGNFISLLSVGCGFLRRLYWIFEVCDDEVSDWGCGDWLEIWKHCGCGLEWWIVRDKYSIL